MCQAQAAHGKRPSPCQLGSQPKILAVGQPGHTAKALSCARYIAQGKGSLCLRLFAVCPLPCAAHRTRQTICRGLFGLCRVPLAHGKRAVSRSVCIHLQKIFVKLLIKIKSYIFFSFLLKHLYVYCRNFFMLITILDNNFFLKFISLCTLPNNMYICEDKLSLQMRFPLICWHGACIYVGACLF